jgi:hypothetical protein
MTADIDPTVLPSGAGCAQCDAGDRPGWWFHLRRCARCGNIGCCDSSPSQHASVHAAQTGHPVARSFEPGESWFWDCEAEDYLEGVDLAAPQAHPVDQPVPGPRGRVPADWQIHLH